MRSTLEPGGSSNATSKRAFIKWSICFNSRSGICFLVSVTHVELECYVRLFYRYSNDMFSHEPVCRVVCAV